MINIEKHDNGYLIENTFWFTETEKKSEYINLMVYRSEDMEYSRNEFLEVAYPGEYDKNDILVKVFEGDSRKLNFLIRYNDKNILLVQTPNLLERQELPTIHTWIYNDPYTATILEKLEMDGEKYLLGEENNSTAEESTVTE